MMVDLSGAGGKDQIEFAAPTFLFPLAEHIDDHRREREALKLAVLAALGLTRFPALPVALKAAQLFVATRSLSCASASIVPRLTITFFAIAGDRFASSPCVLLFLIVCSGESLPARRSSRSCLVTGSVSCASRNASRCNRKCGS
jgi:hypothetical protein